VLAPVTGNQIDGGFDKGFFRSLLSTNARWRVLIGTQNVVHRELLCGTVEVIDDDQNRAILSACVLAADRPNLKEM
jgi:hypothetical protein